MLRSPLSFLTNPSTSSPLHPRSSSSAFSTPAQKKQDSPKSDNEYKTSESKSDDVTMLTIPTATTTTTTTTATTEVKSEKAASEAETEESKFMRAYTMLQRHAMNTDADEESLGALRGYMTAIGFSVAELRKTSLQKIVEYVGEKNRSVAPYLYINSPQAQDTTGKYVGFNCVLTAATILSMMLSIGGYYTIETYNNQDNSLQQVTATMVHLAEKVIGRHNLVKRVAAACKRSGRVNAVFECFDKSGNLSILECIHSAVNGNTPAERLVDALRNKMVYRAAIVDNTVPAERVLSYGVIIGLRVICFGTNEKPSPAFTDDTIQKTGALYAKVEAI